MELLNRRITGVLSFCEVCQAVFPQVQDRFCHLVDVDNFRPPLESGRVSLLYFRLNGNHQIGLTLDTFMEHFTLYHSFHRSYTCNTATYWKRKSLTGFISLILTVFLKRDWILITGLRCTPGAFAPGVQVHGRPIRYFYGDACHNFSLNERAKGRNTTQRRAGLPVRNRIG
jgi:hypothetical protein